MCAGAVAVTGTKIVTFIPRGFDLAVSVFVVTATFAGAVQVEPVLTGCQCAHGVGETRGVHTGDAGREVGLGSYVIVCSKMTVPGTGYHSTADGLEAGADRRDTAQDFQ